MKTELNLPKTDFPQKANSHEREPLFNEMWEKNSVFARRSDLNKVNDKKFLLHDGPPYANGDLHMGHVLNKTLKDVVNKWKLMDGYQVKFTPGWDCHGLPTELKVQQEFGDLPTSELRKKCRDHAEKYMNLQRDSFKRLGLTADWDNPYLTMSKEYEYKQLQAVGELLLSGEVYRDEKPVYYSPSTKTVLAEAELEYHDRTDPSVYVKFVTRLPNYGLCDLLVWTTMPWTLPGNKAVCVNPTMEYSLVEFKDESFLVATSRLSVLKDDYTVVKTFLGSELEGLKYTNPLANDEFYVVSDRFVKDDSGTGLVHLCPAHGDEDFRVCKENGVEPTPLTDMDGNYLHNGMYVLDEGTKWVLEYLEKSDMLYYKEDVTHSYPHDWRSKTPVLFMLTKQFFLRLTDKELLMEQVKDVDFSKNAHKNRFKGMLHNRDNWCLSRQRKWGFPLPVFYKEDEVFFDQKLLDHLLPLFEEFGSDCWFDMTTDELLPEEYRSLGLGKCEDTVDVWMDSGLSWNNVLDRREADLYFEGSDQHRGWFQSSFLTSVMLQGKAPYKKVLTHGFVLDKDGRKMSKSLGNVVDPNKYLEMYNADVMRLWTLSVDYTSDVRFSDTAMKGVAKVYFKLRNNFRYMLANLYDYDTTYVPTDLCEKDKLALDSLEKYKTQMEDAYNRYDFRKLFNLTTSFVSNTSKRYFDLETKELLYEGDASRKERRDRQYVMNEMLNATVKLMAPMTPYLCEDVWGYMNTNVESVFLS